MDIAKLSTARIAIVGNSQVGTLKQAWDRIGDHPTFGEVHFFAGISIYKVLSVDARKILSISTDSPKKFTRKSLKIAKLFGYSELALADMDCVFLCGTLSPRIATRALRRLARNNIKNMREMSDGKPLISRAEARTHLRTSLREHLPSEIWHHWDAPRICVVENPRRSEILLDNVEDLRPLLQDATGIAEILDLLSAIHRKMLATIGIDLVTQPEETLTACGLTDHRFSRQSQRLLNDEQHSETDTAHMNAEYGALQLAKMAEYVARLRSGGNAGTEPGVQGTPENTGSEPQTDTGLEKAFAMTTPYSDIEPRAFWKSAVTNRAPLDPGDLYRPRFEIPQDMRIVTAGSCFAQHLGRALRDAGFNVVDDEPGPGEMDDETAHKFGYRLYSARYGNIYTARQLMQMMDEMQGDFEPALPVWEKDGRFHDAMRPNVEPDGLPSAEAVFKHRKAHLAAVRQAYRNCDLMVFTFGLTEAWVHRDTGTVYPTAPGVVAGNYDRNVFGFMNFGFDDIISGSMTLSAISSGS